MNGRTGTCLNLRVRDVCDSMEIGPNRRLVFLFAAIGAEYVSEALVRYVNHEDLIPTNVVEKRVTAATKNRAT